MQPDYFAIPCADHQCHGIATGAFETVLRDRDGRVKRKGVVLVCCECERKWLRWFTALSVFSFLKGRSHDRQNAMALR